MSVQLPLIRRVIVDRESIETPFARRFIQNLKDHPSDRSIPVEITQDHKHTLNIYRKKYQYAHEAKDTILIHPYKGNFLHACPGSDGMVCCHYFVINFGLNCSFDCSYCYLQSYLNIPMLTLFSNIEDMADQIKAKVQKNSKFHWRIGTGEYTDSLALDHLTELSKFLVPLFSELPNATLELKTKSNNIKNLTEIETPKNVVVSWSLNPDFIVNMVEKLTSTLDERLQAAKILQEKGFQIGFHLDPIIWYDQWEEDYERLIERIFDVIPAGSIRWVSMGTFRYSPNLKNIIRSRDGDLSLTNKEMFPASDGKTRYLAPQRAQMYRRIRSMIREKDKEMFVYLCMETQSMWERVFGFIPKNPNQIEQGFEKRRQFISSQT